MAQVFGATHTAASIDEAKELVAEITWGRMADKVIMTMGLGKGELIADAMAMTAKRGRVVLTNVYNDDETAHPHEPRRPDPHGEATRRRPVRIGEPAQGHPPPARAVGSRARSSSTSS